MKVQVLEPLGNAEKIVLSLVLTGGYTSREEIAKKCGEAGLDVGERSVSRYLRNLTERGLLKRVGNGYEPTGRVTNNSAKIRCDPVEEPTLVCVNQTTHRRLVP